MLDIKQAARMVRDNPDALLALEAEEEASRKAAEKEAKRVQKAEGAVFDALEARTQALIEDYRARETRAIEEAAEALALRQLREEHGLIPMKQRALSPAPVRLGRRLVELAWNEISKTADLPWRKGSPSEIRSAQAREAAEFFEAERRASAEREAAREAAAAARDKAERELNAR